MEGSVDKVEVRDYFEGDDTRPFHLKELEAVLTSFWVTIDSQEYKGISIGVFVCFQKNESLCTLLDDRISSLQHRMISRPSVKKQQALFSEFADFLSRLQQPADASTCDVHTLLRFLAFKEISG